jgi:hypothetical protein
MDYHSFLILIIVALCFICGCTTAPAVESTPGGVGITDITLPAEDERVSLAYALQDLAVADSEGFPNTGNMTIHQIRGDGMDLSGNASTWILGVTRHDNTTGLLVYSGYSWKALTWQGNFTASAIDTEALLKPNDLFETQADTIAEMLAISTGTEISLELSNGEYKVYAKNGERLSALSFNADSGELIVSE